MRLEYNFELSEIEVPRFAVEAVEGIGKLFTLATLVLNVLENRSRCELVFHGLNPEDPDKKIEAFREVLASSEGGGRVRMERGRGGRVPGSSSYFQWIALQRG